MGGVDGVEGRVPGIGRKTFKYLVGIGDADFSGVSERGKKAVVETFAAAEAYRHRAHNNSGNFYPIILSDGIVCGNWKPFSDQLSYEMFEESDSLSAPQLEQAWENYRLFLKR